MHVIRIEPGADQFDDEREQMHRHRHLLFVEALGWSALQRPDGLDIDAFDGPDATYLVALCARRVVRGSLRLLPTTGEHMLRSTFRAYVAGALPMGSTIWEWSRHAPGLPSWAPELNAAARAALHVAAAEHALERGISAYTALMDTRLLRSARAWGWPCVELGNPRSYAEGAAVAVLNPVGPLTLTALRARTGLTEPVIATPQANAA
jgi:N-acyl-L-homoserine lactone synthetase